MAYWVNHKELEAFYQAPIGCHVQSEVLSYIQECWVMQPRDTILSLGYTKPFIRPLLGQHHTHIYAYPKPLRPTHKVKSPYTHHALIDETLLPFSNDLFNKILVVHLLEYTEHREFFLEEISRILTPNGRCIFIIPNTHALIFLKQFESFLPSSRDRELTETLVNGIERLASLHITSIASCVYLPLCCFKFAKRYAYMVEQALQYFFPSKGSLVVIEVQKQQFAPKGTPVKFSKTATARYSVNTA